MFVGAGAVLTPEPTMLSKAGGIAGIGVGADFAATGWNQMWGKPSQTLTAQALAAGVQGAGFQPDTANRIASYTEEIIGAVLPFGVVGKAAALGSATGKSGTKALSNAGSRAPEFSGGQITESGFLNAVGKYLGEGYKEISPGRYISSDKLHQVRFGPHEVRGPQLHGHFEAYDVPGGRIIENTRVNIIRDP